MVPVEGLFETHIAVRDIERSIAFYRDVVRLELGIAQSERPAAFFGVGGRGESMLGMLRGVTSVQRLFETHNLEGSVD